MIGRRVGGRYQILSRLGEGGMAIVYKAKDLILDRFVAVKILRPELAGDEEFVRRFHREAESVASLSHPNIVAIYDIGEEEDCYYIVMEYVHAMTLKEFIKDYSPISISESVDIMKQVARAIAHAHARGIVHRDIKPHNILIDEEEHVKVTDFGIALAISDSTITYTHSIIGSAHYLSPEQARGGKATVKSDIYAFGIVMFELLTGRLPFPGTSPVSVALKHLSEPMPLPSDFRPEIPQSLENIIIRALAKRPQDRYESMTDLYEDLETSLNPDRAGESRLILAADQADDPDDDDEKTIKMAPVVAGRSEDTIAAEQPPAAPDPEKDGKKKKKKRRWPVVFGILLLLIAAGLVIGLTLLPKLFYVENVRVPDVTGKTYQQAEQILTNKNLKVTRTNQHSATVKKGLVFLQNPAAGTDVKAKTAVGLFVSEGPSSVQVQNYVGYDRDSVANSLQGQGFKKIVWHQQESLGFPDGEIISQNPAAGTQVVPSDTVLELTYSTGNPNVTVPDLSGKTQDQANQQLKSLGLSAAFATGTYSDTVQKGNVLSQDPAPGSLMAKGSSVRLALSKGSEPQSKEIDQPIKVVYSKGNGGNKGQPVRVQIYYTDANHTDTLFTDESITDTKTYTIPFILNPGQQGSYSILLDGVQKKTGTVNYPN
ncbi:Stk1 family PASTA domain-containing Ser/Thr kinase [Sporolactobacillus sp. CQH2019]|uniref:Stk1 family PASTA domain-containing Ser/Thr kinase n=1 Tax=Sporolactobacillus sp. CQH2019 TaxID=3023512 RepID=UPI0023685423|nr:Stk1 family PASTA domain-containing Ser/Thr kinase [Sporolactobacillus sp. CQH2019]MDD9147106.1 Stk1 family PASTA domain-containing Ser/Thr kinase [Sporolactobacillus sp. CQH2019]